MDDIRSTNGSEGNTEKCCKPEEEHPPPEQAGSFAHFLDTREESEHLSLAEEFTLTNEALDYFARPELNNVWVHLDALDSDQTLLFRHGAAALMHVVSSLVAQGELIAEYISGEDGQHKRTDRYKFPSCSTIQVGSHDKLPYS